MGLLDREDTIHYVVREQLKNAGWILIAGEYPNGSDDELHSLRIMDPYFAKDYSPAHRKHSLNKLVPDLIAFKDCEFLIIEMKPQYSKADEEKLEFLLTERKSDLLRYLKTFISRYFPELQEKISSSIFTPVLGFKSGATYSSKDSFVYLLVNSLERMTFERH